MVVSAHLEKEGRKMILAVLRGAITCSNKHCLGMEKIEHQNSLLWPPLMIVELFWRLYLPESNTIPTYTPPVGVLDLTLYTLL